MYLLKIILLFSFITSALAELPSENGKWKDSFSQEKKDCGNTDLAKDHPIVGDYFSRPKDQGNIAWCYGFAASDLLTVKVGKPVSSIHTSVAFQSRLNKNIFHKVSMLFNRELRQSYGNKEVFSEGGSVKSSLRALRKKKKVCSEESLPFSTSFLESTSRLLENFEELKRSFHEYKSQEDAEHLICSDINTFLTSHPQIQTPPFKVLMSLNEKMIENSFEKLIELHCSKKSIPVPKFKIGSIIKPHGKKKRTKKFFKKINSLLEEGKPLAIGYNSGHIAVEAGAHSSTLIGKRWKDGKCQYKIRNTWGESCIGYRKDTVLDCNSDQGAFWVDEKTLYRMSVSLDYIE